MLEGFTSIHSKGVSDALPVNKIGLFNRLSFPKSAAVATGLLALAFAFTNGQTAHSEDAKRFIDLDPLRFTTTSALVVGTPITMQTSLYTDPYTTPADLLTQCLFAQSGSAPILTAPERVEITAQEASVDDVRQFGVIVTCNTPSELREGGAVNVGMTIGEQTEAEEESINDLVGNGGKFAALAEPRHVEEARSLYFLPFLGTIGSYYQAAHTTEVEQPEVFDPASAIVLVTTGYDVPGPRSLRNSFIQISEGFANMWTGNLGVPENRVFVLTPYDEGSRTMWFGRKADLMRNTLEKYQQVSLGMMSLFPENTIVNIYAAHGLAGDGAVWLNSSQFLNPSDLSEIVLHDPYQSKREWILFMEQCGSGEFALRFMNDNPTVRAAILTATLAEEDSAPASVLNLLALDVYRDGMSFPAALEYVNANLARIGTQISARIAPSTDANTPEAIYFFSRLFRPVVRETQAALGQ